MLIRSHGESRAVYQVLEDRRPKILDATCPNVTHIHQMVQQAEAQGRAAR